MKLTVMACVHCLHVEVLYVTAFEFTCCRDDVMLDMRQVVKWLGIDQGMSSRRSLWNAPRIMKNFEDIEAWRITKWEVL